MCGFAGFFQPSGFEAQKARQVGLSMGQAIAHRGPDDADVWLDADAGIMLSHRRLAVTDVSDAGHQPMRSSCGRYVIVFNGEIYNHLDLRREIEHVGMPGSWRGHSDTETLLAGFSIWGIPKTLERSIGMFAFAVWDCCDRVLTLGRDRMGEKPLYYGWQGQGEQSAFLFGSELKSLKIHPNFKPAINRGALSLLMRHNYIPAPNSIYQGISKLEPGTLLQFSSLNRKPKKFRYWELRKCTSQIVYNSFKGSANDAVDALDSLVRDAVCKQMIADVPLGAFLSGGIDSSAIVALMQCQSSKPIKTFTIGFHESNFNEAIHARKVADHLGTDHTELYVTSAQAMKVIPRLPVIYCEPFADSSQIPTFIVSELARRDVTVALSGDAGDELFCGYTRYEIATTWWKRLKGMPEPVRRAINLAISATKATRLEGLLPSNVAQKLDKVASMASSDSLASLYRAIVSNLVDPCDWLVDVDVEAPSAFVGSAPFLAGLQPVEQMMYLDMQSYLPDDILVKVDRAAMSVGLETRAPFLDHRIVEFAWQLPVDLKLREGLAKWPLRQVLHRYVPRALIERPKRGFSVPLQDWLRGPLQSWADSLLDEQRLNEEGFFNTKKVRKAWAEHMSGRRNWSSRLWTVLIFQAWLEEQHRQSKHY